MSSKVHYVKCSGCSYPLVTDDEIMSPCVICALQMRLSDAVRAEVIAVDMDAMTIKLRLIGADDRSMREWAPLLGQTIGLAAPSSGAAKGSK